LTHRATLIVLGMAAVLFVANYAAADAAGFEGKWDVLLVCPKSGDGALPFTFEFPAAVKDDVLHGEYGTPGNPGWLPLDGNIQPNGDAIMKAHRLTGHSAYNLNNTACGVPYMHPVTAHFDGSQGRGTWAAPRTCDFTFTKM
jgi:hypothetical protein